MEHRFLLCGILIYILCSFTKEVKCLEVPLSIYDTPPMILYTSIHTNYIATISPWRSPITGRFHSALSLSTWHCAFHASSARMFSEQWHLPWLFFLDRGRSEKTVPMYRYYGCENADTDKKCSIHRNIHIYVYIYIYTIDLYRFVCICKYIYIYIYIFVHIYIHTYTHIYIYIRIHSYVWNNAKFQTDSYGNLILQDGVGADH